MSDTCGFCACQLFWWNPPAGQATQQACRPTPRFRFHELTASRSASQTQSPAANDICAACSHTRIEHGPIPPTFNCAQLSCPCLAFQLASRSDRLFSSLCHCGHPWAVHRRSPAVGATHPSVSHVSHPLHDPPSSSQSILAAQPAASSSATTITLFGSTLPGSAQQSANAQRVKSAKRHRTSSNVLPRGSVGSRTSPPAPVRVVSSIPRAPIPSTSSLPAATRQPSTSLTSAADVEPRGRGRPPAQPTLTTRILVLVADPTTPFARPRQFPSLASLNLAADFNILRFIPSHYPVLVQRLDELHLVIEVTLTAAETQPPLLLNTIWSTVESHLRRHDYRLDTSGAQLAPQVNRFRLLIPCKTPAAKTKKTRKTAVDSQPAQPATIQFTHNDVYDTTFQLSNITRASASVLGSKHIVVCPGDPSWLIYGPVDDPALSLRDDVAVAVEPTFDHRCSVIRHIDYYSTPSAPHPSVVVGRCRLICQSPPASVAEASHSGRRQSPMQLDNAPAQESDDPEGQHTWYADYDEDNRYAPDDDDWLLPPHRRRSASPERRPSYDNPPGPSTHRRGVVPFSPPAGFPPPSSTRPPRTPVRDASAAPYDRFLEQLVAHAQDPLSVLPDVQVDLTPTPPPGRISDVIEVSDSDHSPHRPTQPARPTRTAQPDDEDPLVAGVADPEPSLSASNRYGQWHGYLASLTRYLGSMVRKVDGATRTVAFSCPAPVEDEGDSKAKSTPPPGRVMGRILRYLTSSMRCSEDYIINQIRDEFQTPELSCHGITMQNLLCNSYNVFRIGRASGPGTERALITDTIRFFVESSGRPELSLWRQRGDHYYYPFKALPVDPSDTELNAIRTCGFASAWALFRLGYIPFIDPIFLLLGLVRILLSRHLRDPAILGLLLDNDFVALAAREDLPVLRLYPEFSTEPLPAQDSSKAAELLHARLIALGINPTAPRAPKDHTLIGLALFSFVIFGMSFSRHADPPEWDAFFEGFNVDFAFDNPRAKSSPLALFNFMGPAPEQRVISVLKHIVIALCCPPPSADDVRARLRLAVPPFDMLLPLMESLRLLIEDYLAGVGHPADLVPLLGLDPTDHNPHLRPTLFVCAISGMPFLRPCEETDVQYPLEIQVDLPTDDDDPLHELVHDVRPFKFVTCARAIRFIVNDALHDFVSDSVALIQSKSASQRTPGDTPFANFLHSQLVNTDPAAFNKP
ncbi:hypothetical protein AURDEDRAFT_163270 [Auricularia subglabra TFB-10046 SS5]|nr:hypothetical protein AURDEDRAFT_163270 [Auricularia subglabra TFB-10046 SS5]